MGPLENAHGGLRPAAHGPLPPHLTSTTPAASALSPTSRARARTRSSATRSTSSSTSNTAAPAGPTPTPATAPASSSRCRTASSARSCRSPCRQPGAYGAGLVFLPHDGRVRGAAARARRAHRREEGQTVLGWRPVPIEPRAIGRTAAAVAPVFEQVFVGRGADARRAGRRRRFERQLYVIRKRIEHAVDRTDADRRSTAGRSTSSASRRRRSSTRAC